MILKEKDGVRWLEFELFQPFPELVHGVFLKHGGCSSGVFDSLNFGRNNGDPDENVSKNIAKARDVLNLHKFAYSNQVHGSEVIYAKSEGFIGAGDAITTHLPNLGLLIKHADCQATLFYDPVKKVIANVHAGWRGNVLNIYSKTVKFMAEHHKSNPEDLRVGISPSLGPQDAQFINYKTELPEHFWKYQVSPLYFDLWEIGRQQLIEAGVPENNIQVAGICTYANPHDYFSYRRARISGRHGTFLAMREHSL
ncbi:peptidoglycan editing factor PgeF [soil metagenome]